MRRCRHNRRSGGRSFDEDRRIAADREIDPKWVATSFALIILFQLGAKPARLDPHDGVGAGIELAAAAEDADTDGVLFQFAAVTAEHFLHRELEELAEFLRAAHPGADDHLVQMFLHQVAPGGQ